jgi:hypothetical protein
MRDFLFDVEVLATAPANAFQHLPQQIMIRVEGLTDDMQNCKVYCETICKQPVVPPYTSRLNVTQDRLILPYAMIAPALNADGDVNTEVVGQILAQFNVQLIVPAVQEGEQQ